MTTLTEGFPYFFLSCKANARVNPAKDGARPALFLIFVLFYVMFVLCRSLYCLCVYVYWIPRVMKHYSPTGRRNHGRPLKRLLDTWDRNGSTSGPTPWQIYDDDDDVFDCLTIFWIFFWRHKRIKSIKKEYTEQGDLCWNNWICKTFAR